MITTTTDVPSTPRCTCKNMDYCEKQNAVSGDFDNVFLPLPPLDGAANELLEVYGRFMRHMRLAPTSNIYVKILSGIQFTADMLDLPDEMVARMLADMGLRAPRKAFPESYLNLVDRSLLRAGWDIGAPCESSVDMKRFWDDIGEDKFAAFQGAFDRLCEPVKV